MEQMENSYKTIADYGEGEIVEKKSRFLCKIYPVHSEEEALTHIEQLKKQYWDARHNCYAYIIGKNSETVRCSDDGEPSGTAGRPMLEVLQKEELKDVLAVVTRYFGGVLLGTGGLVRAYTQAVQEGLQDSGICEMVPMSIVGFTTDYNAIGKMKYVLGQAGVDIINEEYTHEVVLQVAIPQIKKEVVLKELTEVTNGKLKSEELEIKYMPKKIK